MVVREEDYERAAAAPIEALQKATQPGADGGCPGLTPEEEFAGNVARHSQSNEY
jgi:hypothetical protein